MDLHFEQPVRTGAWQLPVHELKIKVLKLTEGQDNEQQDVGEIATVAIFPAKVSPITIKVSTHGWRLQAMLSSYLLDPVNMKKWENGLQKRLVLR